MLLGDVSRIRTGNLDVNAKVDDGKYPFFTCAQKPEKIDTFSFDCECVLVAGNGDLNVKYYSGKFDAYQRTYVIEVLKKDLLDTKFLFHFLNKYVDKLRSQSIGGVIKYIKMANLTDIELPDYSLSKQRDIVKILDTAYALCQKRKEQLALLDDYLNSVFLDMFGDPEENNKNWHIVKLKECLTTKAINGFFAKNEHYSPDGVSIIWISDFINKFYADVSNIKRVKVSAKDIAKYKVGYGDVLFCRSSLNVEGIGKAGIVPRDLKADTIFECHIIKLSFDISQLIPEFFRVMSDFSYFRRQIMKHSKTATMTTIGQEGIINSNIILPPIDLQKRFVEVFFYVNETKQKMCASLDEMDNHFNALMQRFFGKGVAYGG